MNIQKIVEGAICRWQDVPVHEVAGGIRIYRKTVKEADLLKYAKTCLLEALASLQQVEGREFTLLLESRAGSEADDLKAVSKYLSGWQVGCNGDFIAYSQDRIKTAYAVLQYVGAIQEEREFSNFLLRWVNLVE